MKKAELITDLLEFRPRRVFYFELPMEPPFGTRELFNFEAMCLAAIPSKEFKPFLADVGLGYIWKSRRGLWNRHTMWYFSKIKRVLTKVGYIADPNRVFSIGARLVDTEGDPMGRIILSE